MATEADVTQRNPRTHVHSNPPEPPHIVGDKWIEKLSGDWWCGWRWNGKSWECAATSWDELEAETA